MRFLSAFLLSLVLLTGAAVAQSKVIVQGAQGGAATVTNGKLDVNAAVTPGGTQDVNVKQIGGTTTATGNGTTNAGTQRVTLSSDGTGVVGLSAGSAIIGKVGIDQTTPGTTNGVVGTAATVGGASYAHIAAGQATTTVKSGAGTLYAIILNNKAVATNVTTIYDNTAASGTVIGIPDAANATADSVLNYGPYGIAFATGLTINTATANGADMTVVYK